MNLVYITILISSLIIDNCRVDLAPQFKRNNNISQNKPRYSSFEQSSSSSLQQYINGTHLITVNRDLTFKVVRLVSESITFLPNLNSVMTFGNGTHLLKVIKYYY
jgi:hypothetical protein